MSSPNISVTSIPILDFSLTKSPTTRNEFLSQLRHSLINVGLIFLYLSNHTVSFAVIDSLIEYIPKLFALSQEAKDDIAMTNSGHFLGYSRLGTELTKGKVDVREQFDFATPLVSRWKGGSGFLSAQPGINFPFHSAVNFSEFDKEPSGKVNLIGKVK